VGNEFLKKEAKDMSPDEIILERTTATSRKYPFKLHSCCIKEG